jgi:hypothetical protein
MTAALSAATEAAVAYVHGLDDESIRAALTNEDPAAPRAEDDPTPRFAVRMDRRGEDTQSIAAAAQMRAIYTSPWFWALAALFPNNRIWWPGKDADQDKRREGRPIHFPDYLMLFLICCAGIAGIDTLNRALATLRDPRTWRDLVEHMDQYVPDGWTRLGDLPDRHPHKAPTTAAAPRRGRPVPLMRRRGRTVVALRSPIPDPPTPAVLDYWIKRWRGFDKEGNPLAPANPYFGVRDVVHHEFERLAIEQAQHMGVLDVSQDFAFGHPDRDQFIGFDGVVFSAPRSAATVGTYQTGEGKMATGSKWGITSCRVDGQRHSRVILSLSHIHKTLSDSLASEQEVVRDTVPRIHDLAAGGVKGLLVDSVIRGQDVMALQRQGITVVNHPHAASNPDGGSGNRHNDTRTEKSHLRRVATHVNSYGLTCEHPVFAVGGEFVQVVMNGLGDYELERLDHIEYQQRRNKDGSRREYHLFRIHCTHGEDFTERIPLFHTSPTSSDPDYNWGEVVRVYPPGSAAFKYLYGARNDTEARHADLKARVKHLPADAAGQHLRLLGGAIAKNALAWQTHLRRHGANNVIDDTA